MRSYNGASWTCGTWLSEDDDCAIGLGECGGAYQCRLTADGTGECVDRAAHGDCYRDEDCPSLSTCSVNTPTTTVCETLDEGYELIPVCFETATPPLTAGVCSSRLGTPCVTSDDCDVGICREVGQDESRCTGNCDWLSGDSQYCKDHYGEPTATCCTNATYGDFCAYEGDGSYCDWSP